MLNQQKKLKARKEKNKNTLDFCENVPVIVNNKSNFEHSGLCVPSARQQQMTRSRSGVHVSSLSDMSSFTLYSMTRNNECELKPSSIKSVIIPFWPANKQQKT